MSFFGSTEWYQRVSQGLVPGYSIVHKFGINAAVGTSFEPISSLGTFWKPTANASVRIKAGGNINDTSGGTGARSIIVQGLNASFAETSSTITTTGNTASSNTVEVYRRIDRAYVVDAGAYGGNNAGNIIIEDSSGTTDIIQIDAGEGQTTYGHAAISANTDVWLLGVLATFDTNKTADLKLKVGESINTVAAPFGSSRTLLNFIGLVQPFMLVPTTPIRLDSSGRDTPMDVSFEAKLSATTSPVSIDFELLCRSR